MKINVKVTTKSKKDGIEFDSNQNLYKIKISIAPEEGKANKALIELLASYFKVKRSEIKIITGKTSKTKIIEIIGI
jgi:hypothetical protein